MLFCVAACSYGMRYIAKVLKNSLHAKFPDATEDELLKVQGSSAHRRSPIISYRTLLSSVSSANWAVGFSMHTHVLDSIFLSSIYNQTFRVDKNYSFLLHNTV